MVDGKQYVSIAVGWGGVYGLATRATERQGPGTVYTFALGGNAPKPEFVQYRMDKLLQGVKYDPAKVPDGTLLYVSNCVFCHGVPGVDRGGNIPNLGYMNASYDREPRQVRLQGPGDGARHARLHRQADAPKTSRRSRPSSRARRTRSGRSSRTGGPDLSNTPT